MPKRVVALFALAVMVLWGAQVQAQEGDEPIASGGPIFMEGVRPTGMGLAFTSVASGASGIFHNPAGVASTTDLYHVEGTYEYNPAGSVLNAAIADNTLEVAIPGAISYSYFFGRGEHSGSSGHSARLALALPVIPERVSIGVGGRYLNVHVDDVQVINTLTIDAGALFRFGEGIQVGVAGKNLIDVCDRPELCGLIAPTTIAGGVSFGSETTFLVSADGGIDLTTDPDGVHPFFEVGGEYFAGGIVPLRAGYQRLEATGQNMITAGLGFRQQSAGLDLGFRMDLSDTDNLFFNGSVSIFF